MPLPTNIIINGTFDLTSVGWSGTDIETTYTEGAYLGNGSTNRVAELDGNSGRTTVMQQSVTIAGPITTELTFEATLRTSRVTVGSDGFRAEILDSTGKVIATSDILPPKGDYTSYSVPVSFPAAGTYTVRFTELGLDNSYGAIVDNIELMVCFAGATMIETPSGAIAARNIAVGDLVITERGAKLVRWVGRRHVSRAQMAAEPRYRPVRIHAGALGHGLPLADLWVSRQHRMLVSSPICERMFGHTDILVAAIKLTALPGIHVDADIAEIDYVHLLFDAHEVVFAEGAPSESLLPHSEAIGALSPEALDEIGLIFPGILDGSAPWSLAKPIPKGCRQARLAERIAKNGRAPLEAFSLPA
jgi:hypothetical protein